MNEIKTVVIPAAGTGSRLQEYTKYFNKAICTLGQKPIISYIIEKFNKEDEIIILLGYKGDLLKQVITSCYPEFNIKFVNVDKFQGAGSGLGYSLSKAINLLQKPFIFWSNDTVIDDDINKFDYSNNWMILSEFNIDKANSYRHAKISNNKVDTILVKGNYDISGKSTLPYIGVSFIKDWKNFWEVFKKDESLFINAGQSAGLNNISNINYYITKSWIDTGNKQILQKYKKIYNQKMGYNILQKPKEAIWFIKDKVIKFHIDEKFIKDRVQRFKTLINDNMKKNHIKMPELISYDKNIYVYKKEEGIILSSIINPNSLIDLLNNYYNNIDIIENKVLSKNIYDDFYKNKTLSRINEYCNQYEQLDKDVIINGLNCYSVKNLMNKINWDKLSDKCILTNNYHGDFHLQNILFNQQNKEWILLDWRQNFGKSKIGDFYYDLAKMWHSLIVNHNMVKNNYFNIKYLSKDNIEIDIHRTFIDTECELYLINWLKENNMLQISQFLTALIFLNICACHQGIYNTFLFYLGKYLLNKFYLNYKKYFT